MTDLHHEEIRKDIEELKQELKNVKNGFMTHKHVGIYAIINEIREYLNMPLVDGWKGMPQPTPEMLEKGGEWVWVEKTDIKFILKLATDWIITWGNEEKRIHARDHLEGLKIKYQV